MKVSGFSQILIKVVKIWPVKNIFVKIRESLYHAKRTSKANLMKIETDLMKIETDA